MMKKILDILMKIQRHLAGILFLVIFAVNTMEILSRNLFNHSFLWVSDLSSICIVWMVCLGMAVGIYQKEHIFLEVVVSRLPYKARHVVTLFVEFMSLAFFSMLFVTGMNMALSKRTLIFPSTQWPMFVMYMALPVFALSAALYMIPSLVELLKGQEKYREAEGGDVRFL